MLVRFRLGCREVTAPMMFQRGEAGGPPSGASSASPPGASSGAPTPPWRACYKSAARSAWLLYSRAGGAHDKFPGLVVALLVQDPLLLAAVHQDFSRRRGHTGRQEPVKKERASRKSALQLGSAVRRSKIPICSRMSRGQAPYRRPSAPWPGEIPPRPERQGTGTSRRPSLPTSGSR